MTMITWNEITRAAWLRLGLCADSYAQWSAYPTPEAAYEASAEPSDLIRAVFGVLSRRDAVGVLVYTITPTVQRFAPQTSIDLLVVVAAWSRGEAFYSQLVAVARAARAEDVASEVAHSALRVAMSHDATSAAVEVVVAMEEDATSAEGAVVVAVTRSRLTRATRLQVRAARLVANSQLCARIREACPFARLEAAYLEKQ